MNIIYCITGHVLIKLQNESVAYLFEQNHQQSKKHNIGTYCTGNTDSTDER